MQMRIDRDQPVERVRKQLGNLPRRHGLARLEPPVLPHIGEIGRHQADVRRAELARRRRGEDQRQNLVVRSIERADDDD